jgi:hypothetical protein
VRVLIFSNTQEIFRTSTVARKSTIVATMRCLNCLASKTSSVTWAIRSFRPKSFLLFQLITVLLSSRPVTCRQAHSFTKTVSSVILRIDSGTSGQACYLTTIRVTPKAQALTASIVTQKCRAHSTGCKFSNSPCVKDLRLSVTRRRRSCKNGWTLSI